MQGFEKYYRKTWHERLEILNKHTISDEQVKILKDDAKNPELGETMIENFISEYHLPEGVALNLVVNGIEYLVPMATEEPSVIAAASHGGSIVKKSGGFKAETKSRLMIGQVVLENVSDVSEMQKELELLEKDILKVANDAHPSIVRRGGGARSVKLKILADDLLALYLAVDVREAMGANMLNTMLEATAEFLRKRLKADVLFAILSNYATDSLVSAKCSIGVETLAKNGVDGCEIARKIAQASRVAQLDPYRAATHNKGIMNGIDACVLASGNDWRAVEAGAHAYAARSGSYRGLSTWNYDEKKQVLEGELTLPLALGSVGGSISIVPLVSVNRQILQNADAKTLGEIVCSLGLAQNLAALYALVTDGIQKGHMRLQLKSLAKSVGATADETKILVKEMEKRKVRDSVHAKEILKEMREKRDE